jgi:hypothetical protein
VTVEALIKFVQGATIGVPGQSLFGVAGTAVTGSNVPVAAGPIVRWRWELLDVPPASALVPGVLSDGPTPTVTFTPDAQYGFRIKLTVFDNQGNFSIDTRVFGVLDGNGHFIPPFGSPDVELNFGGQTRGWSKYLEQWLASISSSTNTVTTVTTTPYAVLGTDQLIDVNVAGPAVVTLPAAPGTAGRSITIKDTSGAAATNNITVNGNGHNVDGSATYTIGTNYGFVTIEWTGTIWAVRAASASASSSGGLNLTPRRISANTTLASADAFILDDTSGGAHAITFTAAPTDGQFVGFKDAKGTWATHNLTLTGNAGQKVEIPGAPGTYTAVAGSTALSINGADQGYRYDATQNIWMTCSF